MKELDPASILIGEVWKDATSKISYGERREYLLGEELDGVTNYPFRQIVLDFLLGKKDGQAVQLKLMSIYENYPPQWFYSSLNLIGSHDVPRVLTLLEEGLSGELSPEEKKELKVGRLKLAALWQFTFPGVPCIYYGDEAGMEGGEDPLNRKGYPWGEEDEEILNWYRLMIALRNHYDVLRTGGWFPLYAEGSILSYARFIEKGRDLFGQEKKDNTAVVILNRDVKKQVHISLDLRRWCGEKVVDALEDYREIPLEEGRLNILLKPLEGKLFLRDRWGSNLREKRESGVLLHPTSLPSSYGVGGLGREAYNFVDFLFNSGQRLWQILPLNPPGVGNSPYQCFSAFAGNPLLIDPEKLAEKGLLSLNNLLYLPSFPENLADYEGAKRIKGELFQEAFTAFQSRGGKDRFEKFCAENSYWLEDFAFFMALKKHFRGKAWNRWDKGVASRREVDLTYYRKILSQEIDFHKFLQFEFFSQWLELKAYANARGIRIIGDLPIFVAHDSSDVWVNPYLFYLDEEGNPSKIAGVPPDYFSETGQLWGNPHYRWDEMEKDGYRWWKERLALLARLVDIIRIDHFRGFESYWEVPGGEKTAVKGRWVKGPGEKFFASIRAELGNIPLIAEDLGYITPEVRELRDRFNFPGMIVMQFALEGQPGKSFRVPLFAKYSVVYTGTHDNDTLLGWYKSKGKELLGTDPQGRGERKICWHFLEQALRSDAFMVIIPLQDILCLGSEARMNIPGTVEGNWLWRFSRDSLTEDLGKKLRELTEKYRRT